MPAWVMVMVFGGFGGVAPTMMKLASSIQANPEGALPAFGFYIAMLLYAILGGGIAIALGEQNLRGALFAGIAAPALISNAISGAQAASPQPGLDRTANMSFLISVARAAEPGPLSTNKALQWTPQQIEQLRGIANEASSMSKIVTITGTKADQVPVEVNVCFLDSAAVTMAASGKDPNCLRQDKVVAGPGTSKALVAPPNSVGVTVAGKPFVLGKQVNQVGVTAQTYSTGLNDFWWALGGKRKVTTAGVDAVNLNEEP